MVDVTNTQFEQHIKQSKENNKYFTTISTSKNWIKSDHLLKVFISENDINIKDINKLIIILKTDPLCYLLPTKTKSVQYIINILFNMYENACDDDADPKTKEEIIALFCSTTAAKEDKINTFRQTKFYQNCYSNMIKSIEFANFNPYDLNHILNQSQENDSDTEISDTFTSTIPQTDINISNNNNTNSFVINNIEADQHVRQQQINHKNKITKPENKNADSNLTPIIPSTNSNSDKQEAETKTPPTKQNNDDNITTLDDEVAVPLLKSLIINNFKKFIHKKIAKYYIQNQIKDKISHEHQVSITRVYQILNNRFKQYFQYLKNDENKYLSHFIDWYRHFHTEYNKLALKIYDLALAELGKNKIKINENTIGQKFNQIKADFNEHIRLLNTNFAKSIIVHGISYEFLHQIGNSQLFVTNTTEYYSLPNLIYTLNEGMNHQIKFHNYGYIYNNILQFIIESLNQLHKDKYINNDHQIIKSLKPLNICNCEYTKLSKKQLITLLPKKQQKRKRFGNTNYNSDNQIQIISLDKQLQQLQQNNNNKTSPTNDYFNPSTLSYKVQKTNNHNINNSNTFYNPLAESKNTNTTNITQNNNDNDTKSEDPSFEQLFDNQLSNKPPLNSFQQYNNNIRTIMKEEFMKFQTHLSNNINFDINESPEQFLFRMKSDKLTILYGDKNKAKDAQLKIGKIIKSNYRNNEDNATEALKMQLNGTNSATNKDLLKKLESKLILYTNSLTFYCVYFM